MDIRIDYKPSDFAKMFDAKTQRKLNRGVLDRLTTLVDKDIKKRIAKEYNIKLKDIKTHRTRTTQDSMVTSISASKRYLSLTRFNPQEAMSGITVSVKQGQTYYIENAFIAQPSGKDYSSRGQIGKPLDLRGRELFVRLTKNAYPLDSKTPKEQYSLSVGEYLRSADNIAKINNLMRQERKNIEREVVEGMTKRTLKKIRDV